MSFPDDPDHEDQTPPRRHQTTGWRPAWDAATYGRPDDPRLRQPPTTDSIPNQPPDAVPGALGDPYSSPGESDRGMPSTEPSEWWNAETQAGHHREASDGGDRYPSRDEQYYPGGLGAAPDPYQSAGHSGGFGTPIPIPADFGPPPGVTPPQSTPQATSESTGTGRRGDPGRSRRRPGASVPDPQPSKPGSAGRAGRNLPVAIGVGLLLGGTVLVALLLWRPAFFGLIAVAVGVGVWELVRAIRISGVNPPLVPLVVGGVAMTGLAWWGATDALTFGLIVTVLAVMVWRLSDGVVGYGRDVSAATFIAVYLPFLAGFAALLAAPADGDVRVLVTLAAVVLSDTGGYAAGVLFGRHPMAPSVSPKKTWEGLVGSLVATGAGGAVMLVLLFHTSVLAGAVFGVAVSAASVLGDLGESMIKRDLGVKDMSALLPGHGGLMDRLDSVVFAAPTAYALLTLLAPVG